MAINEAFVNWYNNLSGSDESRIREWIAKGNFTVVARLIFFAAWQVASTAERERCAKIVEAMDDGSEWTGLESVASAIRASK